MVNFDVFAYVSKSAGHPPLGVLGPGSDEFRCRRRLVAGMIM